jgi:hypothetical protein
LRRRRQRANGQQALDRVREFRRLHRLVELQAALRGDRRERLRRDVAGQDDDRQLRP